MTRCLCGLLKEVNGTVRLDGQTLKAKQRNKASFCVMQDVNHQLFSDSVWNECELAQPDCPPERIEEILRSFDLLDFKDRHPMALSGGQKQRLAVAPLFSPTRMCLSLTSLPVGWTIIVCWK